MTRHPTIPGPAPWKIFTGETCPHGRDVVIVDGQFVRNHLDSDFCQGGNGYRYSFIPRGELWIDECMPPEEIPLVVLHECEESELMMVGKSYSRAHDVAKSIEDGVRRALCQGGDPMSKKTKTKKLTRRERELASKYIAEEQRTKQYPREQAVAIGISRARQDARKRDIDALVRRYS